jgi:glutamyl-Q tRNA(Asp) synthetase
MLTAVLEFLGQQPPADLLQCTLDEFWSWARAHWDLSKVPKIDAIEYSIEN